MLESLATAVLALNKSVATLYFATLPATLKRGLINEIR